MRRSLRGGWGWGGGFVCAEAPRETQSSARDEPIEPTARTEIYGHYNFRHLFGKRVVGVVGFVVGIVASVVRRRVASCCAPLGGLSGQARQSTQMSQSGACWLQTCGTATATVQICSVRAMCDRTVYVRTRTYTYEMCRRRLSPKRSAWDNPMWVGGSGEGCRHIQTRCPNASNIAKSVRRFCLEDIQNEEDDCVTCARRRSNGEMD